MTTAIIPYEPFSLVDKGEYAVAHRDRAEEARATVLNQVRLVPAARNAVRGLDQDTIYTLIIKAPDGTSLKNVSGEVGAVFRDNKGRIVKHAKFKEIKPSLAKAASTAGAQVLLISIAMQLERVEKGISELKRELHNDRLMEIEGGISMFQQAVRMTDPVNRKQAVLNAVQNLNIGIQKTMRSLLQQIKALPDSGAGFLDNWGRKKTAVAAEAFSPAEESFYQCIKGIQILSECYVVLGEPELAISTLKEYLQKLEESDIQTASQKARLLKSTNGILPEKMWEGFLEDQPKLIKKLDECHALSDQKLTSIEIELKPSELLEAR